MSNDFKKYLILGFLFFFPIFVYVFLSTGINNFARLPVLTEKVNDIKNLDGNESERHHLKIKSQLLDFGEEILENKKSEASKLKSKNLQEVL